MKVYRPRVVCTGDFEIAEMDARHVRVSRLVDEVLETAPDAVLVSGGEGVATMLEVLRERAAFVPVVLVSDEPDRVDDAYTPFVSAISSSADIAAKLVLLLDRLPRFRGLRSSMLGSSAAIASCLRTIEEAGRFVLPTGRTLLSTSARKLGVSAIEGTRVLVFGEDDESVALAGSLRSCGGLASAAAKSESDISTVRALDPAVILCSTSDLGSPLFRAIRRDRTTRWADVVLVDPAYASVEHIAACVADLVSVDRSIATRAGAKQEEVWCRLQSVGPSRLVRALDGVDCEVTIESPRAGVVLHISDGAIVQSDLTLPAGVFAGELALAGYLSLGSGRVRIAPRSRGGRGIPISAALGAASAARPPLLSSRPPPAARPPALAKPPVPPPVPPPVRTTSPELGTMLDDGRVVVVQHATWQGAARVVERAQEGAVTEFDARTRRLQQLLEQSEIGLMLLPAIVDSENHVLISDVEPSGTAAHLPALGWTLPQRLGHFQQVAEVLGDLHDVGVVHAALTPSTVILDADLQPWVAGAILVPIGEATLDVAVDAYSSPEIRDAVPLSAASDVFSLGRYLFFLIAARHPEPSTEAIPRLDAILDSPAGLVRIIRRCTVADVDSRYPTVDELLADLATYGSYGEVGLAHPDVVETNVTGVSASLFPRRIERAKLPPIGEPKPESPSRPSLKFPVDFPRGVRMKGAALGGILLVGVCLLAALQSEARFHEIGALIGAAMLSLALPTGERWSRASRVAFAAACLMGMQFLAPTQHIARWTAGSRLQSDDPRARTQAVMTMIANGNPNLDSVDLTHTQLPRVDLAYASLRDANLNAANLRDAYLTMADLRGASLDRTDIRGADLSQAELESASIALAVCDEFTLFPERIYCEDGHPHRAGPE